MCFERFQFVLDRKVFEMAGDSVGLEKHVKKEKEYVENWKIQIANTLRPEIDCVFRQWRKPVDLATHNEDGFEILEQSLQKMGLSSSATTLEKPDSEAIMLLKGVQGKWDNLREQMVACLFSDDEKKYVFELGVEVPDKMPYMKVPNLKDHFEAYKKRKAAEKKVEEGKRAKLF